MTTQAPRRLLARFSAACLLATLLGASEPEILSAQSPAGAQMPGTAPGANPGAAPPPALPMPSPSVSPSTAPQGTPSLPVPGSAATSLPPLVAPEALPATSDSAPRPGVKPPAQVAEDAFKTTTQDDIAKRFEPYPGGLTAEQVVRQALVTSPELKKTRVLLTRAEANKERAKIGFAPRLDLSARYTHLSRVKMGSFSGLFPGRLDDNGQPILNADGTPSFPMRADPATGFVTDYGAVEAPIPQVLNQYYTQAGLTLPVTDFFLTIAPLLKSARLSADVARAQEQAKQLQVAYDARVAFYQYCHLKGGIVVAEASVKLYDASLSDLKSLVAAGTATETDLIRSQSAKAQAEHLLAQLKGSLGVALTRLSQLMGKPVEDLPNVGEQLIVDVPGEFPDAQKLAADALQRRPEVAALRTTERMRQHMIEARKGAQYPRLGAFANGYYSNPNLRIFPQSKEWKPSWDVGAQITWSPNDFVVARTQVTDAESDLAELHADLEAVEQGIGMEAANAVSSLTTAASEVQSTTEVLAASRRYYDDKRALLLAGAATPNDVLQAQTALTRDALAWVDAYVNLRVAQAALLKVQGKTGLADEAPTDTRSAR
jgi:outer membrane protein TolC